MREQCRLIIIFNFWQAALVGSSVYIMGGFDGQSRDALFRLRLPADVCAIYSGNEDACVFSLGCSACKLASNPNKVRILRFTKHRATVRIFRSLTQKMQTWRDNCLSNLNSLSRHLCRRFAIRITSRCLPSARLTRCRGSRATWRGCKPTPRRRRVASDIALALTVWPPSPSTATKLLFVNGAPIVPRGNAC